ncbi:hypothetical protein FQN49_006411 [Arthroderma sp. PD_2]|nr:hypothetical protein FQN49_006411 [Arthroderma sp. PD_2]
MQSSSPEGIYASLQTLPCAFYPAQSPHELQKDASPHSPPNMNQGMELTHFPEPQLQHLWDFTGELEDVEDIDTLANLGLLDGSISGYQDGLNSLAGSSKGDGGIGSEPLQVNSTPNDSIPPRPDIAGTNDDCQPSQNELPPPTDSAGSSALGKQALKRSFDSIDAVTNFSFDESSGPAKRICHLLADDLEPESNDTHAVEKYPSPCYDGTPTPPKSCGGASTGMESVPGPCLAPSTSYSDISEIDSRRASVGQHMLSLPPNTQQHPSHTCSDSGSRTQRELSVDSLFDDLDNPDVPDAASTHQPLSLPSTARHTLSPSILSPPESPIPFEEPPVREPQPKNASELLQKNNNIKNQDLIKSMQREIFTMPCNAQKYISPYPRMGGPLGYFPSAPTVHVKCVEVAEDTVVNRMNQYRKLHQNLRYDRDKYMWLATEWTAIDSRTGKTKPQKINEECSALRRLIAFKERRANDAMAEAEFWRSKYKDLAVAYSNLSHQHMTATTPRNISAAPSQASQSSSQPTTRAPSISATTNSESISIDLTADEPVSTETRAPEPRLSPNIAALNKMRKKKYQWLNNNRNPTAPQRTTEIEDEDDDELAQMMMQELETSV